MPYYKYTLNSHWTIKRTFALGFGKAVYITSLTHKCAHARTHTHIFMCDKFFKLCWHITSSCWIFLDCVFSLETNWLWDHTLRTSSNTRPKTHENSHSRDRGQDANENMSDSRNRIGLTGNQLHLFQRGRVRVYSLCGSSDFLNSRAHNSLEKHKLSLSNLPQLIGKEFLSWLSCLVRLYLSAKLRW